MRKQMRKKHSFNRNGLLAVAFVLLFSVALSACSASNKLVLSDDGKYVDKKTDIAYLDAPACYEPIAMGEELYGKIGSAEIYEVVGADPEKWLCEATGSVFYAEDIELPALNKMNITYALAIMEDVELSRITDGATLSEIISVYCSGEDIRKPTYFEDTLSVSWKIKLADEELGLYYVLNYIELKEDYVVTNDDGTQINYGRAFIFNRYEGRCVAATGVLSAYVDEYNALNEAK